MAAPTNVAKREKALANPEPSTHGTFETCRGGLTMSVHRGRPEVAGRGSNGANGRVEMWRGGFR